MIEGFDFDADFDESMIKDEDYEHYDPYEWDGGSSFPEGGDEPEFYFEDEDEDWDRFIDLDAYEEEKRQRIAESNEY